MSTPPTPSLIESDVLENIKVISQLNSYADNGSIIFQTDFDGMLLHGNRVAMDYVECSIPELRERSIYEYVREDGHGVLDSLFRLEDFTQPKISKGIYLKGSDKVYVIRFYRHDTLGATMIFFSEVDELDAVAKAAEEQKWAERLQIMLFGMNHELKTPLATARGYLDLMKIMGELNPAHLEGAHTALSKMSDILNDMTAPMRELATGHEVGIDLGQAIDGYVKTMRFVEPTKRYVGRFEAHTEAAQGKIVALSRPRLYQILTNLFDNSVRASKHHEEDAHICIRTHMCDQPHHTDCVVVSFEDNGVGMSEQVLRKVFAPYFTTRERDTGSGLGSYFVFQFVREAGGSIDAESEVGVGTTMHLHLPYELGEES